jgi:signal transduction histidine kinase
LTDTERSDVNTQGHNANRLEPFPREDLIERLRQALFDTLFYSRAYLRPSDIQRLAGHEADVFLTFIADPDPSLAEALGEQLCRAGVGQEAVLRSGRELRRLSAEHSDLKIDATLDLVETYHQAVFQGFVRERERTILEEQEHIRSALQHNLHQYTVQIETAAEVARAAVSSLELDVLLTTAVDLIRERYGLDYVGIYLVDNSEDMVSLQASSGWTTGGLAPEEERRSVRKLTMHGPSTVSRCIAHQQHVLASRSSENPGPEGATSQGVLVAEDAQETSWVAGTKFELALPLVTGERVLGAITAQSAHSGAFSSLDVAGLQIVTDQLANAIQNANLYADARGRANELAAAYEQLKELERLKDQFMQNISHELRTPLMMIRGYAELLSSYQLGELTSDQLDAIDVILRYSNALTILVDDIMAIMDVNTSQVTQQPVALADLLNTSLLDFQVPASNSGVELVSHIDETHLNPIVHANPDHIRRIFDNLVGNAIKFTPAGGQVSIVLVSKDNRAIVEVVDTGIGIPQEMLSRLFERFFQVDGSRRRRYGGTGLGLALVKELVESYGGAVEAESPGIDRGSTFRVVLPTVPH